MARLRKIFRVTLIVLTVLLIVVLVPLSLVLSHDSPCAAAPALRAGTATMKGVAYRCYGTPDVLNVEDLEKPVPADDQVLVRVRAAGINPLDWHYMHGTPYIMRLQSGIGSPEDPRIGVDYAGTVEAVGSKVTRFHPGDEVFGGRNGALAEFVTVRESRNIVAKPSNVSFDQAGGVAVAGITALQALRDVGHLQSGQKVLINGASGGVGTFAVQIAKALGAEVTGVCSTKNLELVRRIGADHVIDYTQQDFTRAGGSYDLIVDMVGNVALLRAEKTLTPAGRIVIVGGGGPEGKWIEPFLGPIKTVLLKPFVHHEMRFMLAELNPKDLDVLGDLMRSGKLTPVVDRTYPLAEARDAMRHLEQGHARGKVIIALGGDGGKPAQDTAVSNAHGE
jgi:NADPH:quinone reductase-like Zn-dependent oxidoreductase